MKSDICVPDVLAETDCMGRMGSRPGTICRGIPTHKASLIHEGGGELSCTRKPDVLNVGCQ
jgi:hypothetical protein